MSIDLERLKALALAATPGPWDWDGRTVDEDGYVHIPECSYLVGLICLAGSYEGYQEDCDYIAAANPAVVLALLEQLTRAVQQVTELKAERNQLIIERNNALVRAVKAEHPLVTGAPVRAPSPDLPDTEGGSCD